MKHVKVAVIGCGAWATAIAHLLSKHHETKLWCHRQEIADEINNTQSRSLLPEVTINQDLYATTTFQEAINQAEAIIFCVASPFVRETIEKWAPFFNPEIPVLSLTKGIVSDTSIWLKQILADQLPNIQYSVLSGPNLALEIAQGKPAASVVASENPEHAQLFQSILSSDSFRVYTSTDIKGVTLGGIVKNVIAIAAGCCDALELGVNAKSSLIARGLQEMIRFGTALGAQEDTFYGLSGVGDLVATCSSTQSRNFKVGYGLAKGMTLNDITSDMTAIPEGVNTTKKLIKLNQEHNISMPITQTVYNVLFNQLSPEEGISQLMNRELKAE